MKANGNPLKTGEDRYAERAERVADLLIAKYGTTYGDLKKAIAGALIGAREAGIAEGIMRARSPLSVKLPPLSSLPKESDDAA